MHCPANFPEEATFVQISARKGVSYMNVCGKLKENAKSKEGTDTRRALDNENGFNTFRK